MREVKIYCDHCGKVLDEMHDYTDYELTDTDYMRVDLCKECFNELDKTIKDFCKKGGTEE